MGGAEGGHPTDIPNHADHAHGRPIERSHRHAAPPHTAGQGFYHAHPHAQQHHPQPHPPQQYQKSPAFAEYQRTQGTERFAGEGRMHPAPSTGQYGEEWEDEEEEEEIDELEDDEGEDEK